MKIRLVVALVGLAISFAAPTFAQQKDTVDPQVVEQLREEDKNFEEAYNGSDMVSTTERITAVGNELHLTRRFRANYQSGGSFIRIEGNASPVFVLEGDTWKIRSETVEVTKKEVSTQSPTPTPSNR